MSSTFNITPPTPGHTLTVSNLPGCSQALLLAQWAKSYAQPFIVICPDLNSAHRLERELGVLGTVPVFLFPDWETLPYEHFSPHPDIISERLSTLYNLQNLKQGIVILPITTLLQQVVPPSYLEQQYFVHKVGEQQDFEAFKNKLLRQGYIGVPEVQQHGEMSVRGSIIDIYPMGSALPIRMDFDDNVIDSLRYFEVDTQKTTTKVDDIQLLPAREYPLSETAITHFRSAWRACFESDPSKSPVYQQISQGLGAQGVEYYLPLFFEKMAQLWDYFPTQSIIVLEEQLTITADSFWKSLKERYEARTWDITYPPLPPEQLYTPVDQVWAALKQFGKIQFSAQEKGMTFNFQGLPDLSVTTKEHPLKKLQDFLATQTIPVLFLAESLGRLEVLKELLAKSELYPKTYPNIQDFWATPDRYGIAQGNLEAGLVVIGEWIVICEADLYGSRIMQRRRRKSVRKTTPLEDGIRSLAELEIGAPIVHINHGVGRYAGLIELPVEGRTQEFMVIHYAKEDKLYVPVMSLNLVSRYSNGGITETAPLHQLGTPTWDKAKQKALEKARDTAAELLELYSKRAAKPGNAFNLDKEAYFEFSNTFKFEETADQTRAITEVLEDLQRPTPMDRLVCGDVGFGKTEVALRAAFVAIQNGKQVAVLVPTTLLAQQHFETFRDRLVGFPFKVEVLSRFRSAKETTEVLAGLAKGTVDLVIGTHKLLQPSIKFKNLGLLIIDEEHRFGVHHKEKLKALRAEVDILTLTATPIPRTLNMALGNIRDLSIITTPPLKRLAIKTFIREYDEQVIQEAIFRELLRGGQVYYLHNDVQDMENTAARLQNLVPQARIGIAHGQMRERDLESVMSDFYHQRFSVLVCSTIIETGIDIPSANTILIERADNFGLAQLHQLRGRVGRSHHQAYAYLLTPRDKKLTGDATKRLEALESATALGSGFVIASQDLEIRGAGELLGDAQSGNINSIGFALYMELLQKTVKALQEGKGRIDFDSLTPQTEIDLKIATLFPHTYVPDVHTRLVLYKRLSQVTNNQELRDLQIELIDRFGGLPEPTQHLLQVTTLRLQAEVLGIQKIEAHAKGGKFIFNQQPQVSIEKLIGLIQQSPQVYKLHGGHTLQFQTALTAPVERLKFIETLLEKLN